MADEVIDFYQSYRKHPQVIDSNKPLSRWLYKPSGLRQSYYYLLRTGYIKKIVKKGKPYLRLTSKANEKLKRDFPIFRMQKRKWDGKWRIVIFDISEKSRLLRNALRRKLKELGFGMLQQSIYISPYNFVIDMYEFLKTQKILGKAFVLTAKHELMGDPQKLAGLVWQLDKLQDEYGYLLHRIYKMQEKMINRKITKKEKKEMIQIKDDYLELLRKDPCLPSELLPHDWMAEDVRKSILKL